MSLQNSARLSVLAFFLVAVAGILLRPLTPVDETRYLAVAWEMHLNGNYFVPTKNFELYTDKPPLLFWTINLVWSVFGVSEFAARLVGPSYALVSLLLTGLLARRIWPEDAMIGAKATLVLSSLLIFSVLGGLTMFDAMLATATLVGILALVGWVDTGARRWWVLYGFALALGVLAKGPVILFHLVPALLTMSLWAKSRTFVSFRQVMSGAGIALLVALGIIGMWLIPAILTGGQEYRDAILWTQTAGRISDSFAHNRPWWFFLMLTPAFLFPWFWIPEFWRRAISTPLNDRALRLCLIWFGAAFLLFSAISGKQPHYLLPELAVFALIVARLVGDRPNIRLWLATVPVFLVAAVAIAFALGLLPMGELETLLTPAPVLAGWALAVIVLCLICIRIGGLAGAAVLSLGLVLTINLLIGLTSFRPVYGSYRFAELIAPYEPKGIAFYGQFYHAEFNFAARLTTSVATPASATELKEWILAHPEGIVIGRPSRADVPWPPEQTVLFRNSDYAIWRVADANYPELKP